MKPRFICRMWKWDGFGREREKKTPHRNEKEGERHTKRHGGVMGWEWRLCGEHRAVVRGSRCQIVAVHVFFLSDLLLGGAPSLDTLWLSEWREIGEFSEIAVSEFWFELQHTSVEARLQPYGVRVTDSRHMDAHVVVLYVESLRRGFARMVQSPHPPGLCSARERDSYLRTRDIILLFPSFYMFRWQQQQQQQQPYSSDWQWKVYWTCCIILSHHD